MGGVRLVADAGGAAAWVEAGEAARRARAGAVRRRAAAGRARGGDRETPQLARRYATCCREVAKAVKEIWAVHIETLTGHSGRRV